MAEIGAETWVLCVNLRGARLFEYRNAEERVNFLRELPRPRVQVRDEHFPDPDDELDVPRPPERLGLEYAVAQDYARQLARYLAVAAQKHRFENVVLAAESQLLRILRDALPSDLRERVLNVIEQDLYDVNTTDLLPYMTELIRRPRAA